MFISSSTPKKRRSTQPDVMNYFSDHRPHEQDELIAPIANLDLEELIDNFIDTNVQSEDENADYDQENFNQNSEFKKNVKSNLVECENMCNSLEDLVKSFDKNVKECFTKYKNIDVGQLAPVQIRSQDDVINDSQ
jgi:hypothetical protein